jgi:hypothetical protein
MLGPPKVPRGEYAPHVGAAGRRARTLRYRVVVENDVPRLRWDGESNRDADDLLGDDEGQRDAPTLDEAIQFLQTCLADGPKPVQEVLVQAQEVGISNATLRRARQALGVRHEPERDATGRITSFTWSLPPKPDSQAG